MKNAITMRELQKMSAGAIQALPHAIPVKSGPATVALLLPIHKVPKATIDRVFAQIDAAAAARTPEQTAALEAMLGERDDA